jgi:predicted aspartyl protease
VVLDGRGLALALALIFVAVSGVADAQAPKIGKPRPAPPTPPNVPPLPPAVLDNRLAVGGDDVKARKVETRLTVEVRINGSGPYNFLVDSGADTSVVGLRIARALKLPLGSPAILNSMTARNLVDRVKVDQLTLGPTTVRDLQLPALQESDLGGQGMIGIDALVHQRLMMDFEKRLIKVEDASKPPIPLPGEIVVIAKRRRGQLILTRVSAAGVPLDAVIDTGSQITIGNLALRDRLIRGNREKFVTIPVTGVTGKTLDLQLARIGELRLGSVTLRNVPIAFADVPPFALFGISREPAMLLGTDLLDTFRRVSLDFRARKVRFQLRRCGSSAVTISTDSSYWSTRISSGDDMEVCRR